jgi:hypothetical protein
MVLATDSWETTAQTAAHLSRQSRADEIELVLVAPPGRVQVPDGARDRLAAIAVVEVPRALEDLPRARAAGVRAATAPVVVFGETHSFPQPGWADVLLRAFEDDGLAAVGPAVANGNPDTLRSWAGMLMDYGPWLPPLEAAEGVDLPGHNSAFRREVLLARGDGLAVALRSDTLLTRELREGGQRVRLEPAARTAHVNPTRPLSWVRDRVVAGRVFASARRAGWAAPRRAAYALAAPLIPLVRLPRVLADARRARAEGAPGARVLPLLAAGLVLNAAGEGLGYAAGAGRAAKVAHEMELHRLAHVRRAERERFG